MNIPEALEAVNGKIEDVMRGRPRVLRELSAGPFLAAGKRLRARLLFDFAEDSGPDAVKAASAIELLHAATLIHDDVLDGSPVRRGAKALHVKRGIPLSVLYGDYLFSESFSLLAEVDCPGAWKVMVRALSEALEGEMEEEARRGDTSLAVEEYLSIIRRKSGALFGASCELGLVLKGSPGALAESAYAFGLAAGSAYQILDDCGDYFGDNGGRGRFNDLREGVITLPLIYLLKKDPLLEKAGLRRTDPRKIAEMMERRGVVSDCFTLARRMLKDAKDGLAASAGGRARGSWFNVAAAMEEKITHAEEEYCDSGKRVCRA